MAAKRVSKKAETAAAKTVAEETAVKTETVNNTAPETKVEKKPASRRTTARKTTAKTTAKTAAKTEKVTNTEVYVQFWGKEVYAKDIVDSIRKIWTDEMGKKAEELLDLKVYIKPEDNGAHYVINGEITGFLGL